MHMNFNQDTPVSDRILFDDFLKIDIRIGTIIDCQDFPESKKPSYKLSIDFGPIGVKKSSAQIKALYNREVLIGKRVMGVVNFPPRQIGKFMSEVLILGFSNERGEVVLSTPDFDLPNGSRLH